MKKTMLIMFSIFFAVSVQAFQVPARINLSPFQITSTVYNAYNRPIICDIQTRGVTYYGQPLFSFLDNVVIYPRTNAYSYVYTFAGNHFVRGDSFANCHWF